MSKEHLITLVEGKFIQPGTPAVTIPIESASVPREELNALAKNAFQDAMFGYEADYGDKLFFLIHAHCHEKWEFNHLHDSDINRIEALEACTVSTRSRFNGISSSPSINLELAMIAEDICNLTIPMLIKVPVYSIRYFLDIHAKYTFNKLRESKHESSDDIISILYEVLFLQQKISICLLEFAEASNKVRQQKGEAMLLGEEVNAMIKADSVFIYLKASMEKNIALLGYILGIKGLENKKTQKSRISELSKRLGELVNTDYIDVLLELISSEAIEDINKYRTGILHKKGIADLQPHNYVGIPAEEIPHLKLYDVMYTQHRKGTLCLIATLAVLTDELMKLNSDDIAEFMRKMNIFKEHFSKETSP